MRAPFPAFERVDRTRQDGIFASQYGARVFLALSEAFFLCVGGGGDMACEAIPCTCAFLRVACFVSLLCGVHLARQTGS